MEAHRWATEDSFETARKSLASIITKPDPGTAGTGISRSLVMLAFAMMAAIRLQLNKPKPQNLPPGKSLVTWYRLTSPHLSASSCGGIDGRMKNERAPPKGRVRQLIKGFTLLVSVV